MTDDDEVRKRFYNVVRLPNFDLCDYLFYADLNRFELS
jgi:hypothetical protein